MLQKMSTLTIAGNTSFMLREKKVQIIRHIK